MSIAFSAKKLNDLDNPQFDRLLAWFGTFQKYVENYKARKKLVPDSQWELYRRMQIKGLREQNLLKAAKDVLKEQWKNRPEALQRKKAEGAFDINGKHNTPKASGRPKRVP